MVPQPRICAIQTLCVDYGHYSTEEAAFVGTRSATKDNMWREVPGGRGKEAQQMFMMLTSERYKRPFAKDLQVGSKETVVTILISTNGIKRNSSIVLKPNCFQSEILY